MAANEFVLHHDVAFTQNASVASKASTKTLLAHFPEVIIRLTCGIDVQSSGSSSSRLDWKVGLEELRDETISSQRLVEKCYWQDAVVYESFASPVTRLGRKTYWWSVPKRDDSLGLRRRRRRWRCSPRLDWAPRRTWTWPTAREQILVRILLEKHRDVDGQQSTSSHQNPREPNWVFGGEARFPEKPSSPWPLGGVSQGQWTRNFVFYIFAVLPPFTFVRLLTLNLIRFHFQLFSFWSRAYLVCCATNGRRLMTHLK